MGLFEDIENEFSKRKAEAEKRAYDFLYGKKDNVNSPESKTQKQEDIVFVFSDESGEIKKEKKTIIEPLVFDHVGHQRYRYVGDLDPPKPKPEPPKTSQKPKGFTKEARTEFIVTARRAGLTIMDENGIIQRPDGLLTAGIFRRS